MGETPSYREGGSQVTIQGLPLFPLNLVLFPGMVLPLHIFEERYRRMIGECLAGEPRFGVVLIREGSEVGGPAKVRDVGTIARIVSVGRYDDGRMDILTVGVERFRVLDTSDALPYLSADVEVLRDVEESPGSLLALANRLHGLLRERGELLGQAEDEAPKLPRDARSLSFVAGVLDIPNGAKQALLESASAAERLRWVSHHLRQEIQLLRVLGPTRPWHGPTRSSPNG